MIAQIFLLVTGTDIFISVMIFYTVERNLTNVERTILYLDISIYGVSTAWVTPVIRIALCDFYDRGTVAEARTAIGFIGGDSLRSLRTSSGRLAAASDRLSAKSVIGHHTSHTCPKYLFTSLITRHIMRTIQRTLLRDNK